MRIQDVFGAFVHVEPTLGHSAPQSVTPHTHGTVYPLYGLGARERWWSVDTWPRQAIKLQKPMITYKVTWLNKSKFKDDNVVWESPDRTERMLEDRHGLWLVAVMTGSFYEFFAMNFFVQCTTFVSFMSIATFVVDSVMQYILPERLFYQCVSLVDVQSVDVK